MECKTVLVVEDEAETREALAQLLLNAGYGVVTAKNGQEALRLLHTAARPCLVILDLLMPVIDGWSFCEMLRSEPTISQIPVVVCSCADPDLQRTGQLALNVEAFHPKPIDADTLLADVRRICG